MPCVLMIFQVPYITDQHCSCRICEWAALQFGFNAFLICACVCLRLQLCLCIFIYIYMYICGAVFVCK